MNSKHLLLSLTARIALCYNPATKSYKKIVTPYIRYDNDVPKVNRRFHALHFGSDGDNSSERPEQHPAAARENKSPYDRNVCIAVTMAPDGREFELTDTVKIARGLGSKLSLPVVTTTDDDDGALLRDLELRKFSHCLCVVPYEMFNVETYAIGIRSLLPPPSSQDRRRKKKKQRAQQQRPTNPFVIDFCPPSDSPWGKRLDFKSGGEQKELLLKAVAPWKTTTARSSTSRHGSLVYDLTAGFGVDSVMMAIGGASEVRMVERDPIVATLLDDALRRLHLVTAAVVSSDATDDVGVDGHFMARVAELSAKLSLRRGDGCDVADMIDDSGSSGSNRHPDVCYLDPMFPPRTKTAKVKKNMQILHGLFRSRDRIDDDDDVRRLEEERRILESAWDVARARVVVKRPINAPLLGGDSSRRKPSHVIRGSINRWDVYTKL